MLIETKEKIVARELEEFPMSRGIRWPMGRSGVRVEIEAERIVDIGRFGVHGDAIQRLLVRLDDGRELQVMYADQEKDAARAMRRAFGKWRGFANTSREIGVVAAWKGGK